VTDDDIGKLEVKIDALRSFVEREPKKSSNREIWLIVMTAVVTLVSTTIGQGALSFYDHWQDHRAQLAQLQINTVISATAPGPAGPAGDINELMNQERLAFVMPSGMLNDWANGFGVGATATCWNNFSHDCLIRADSGINDIRKSLGLAPIPSETFAKIMQNDGLINRLKQDLKDDDDAN
jgi:hypothetical protein